jgi:hypothetical protein
MMVAEDFIAQIAGIADALHQAIDHADGHAPGIHEPERLAETSLRVTRSSSSRAFGPAI